MLASFVSALGATLIKKEGKLQDYKGRLDDRIGVVRLRVKKQSHVVDWDCEVVESLAGGESFVIGTDLAPQLGKVGMGTGVFTDSSSCIYVDSSIDMQITCRQLWYYSE